MSAPVKRNTWQKDAVKHALGESTGFVSAQELHQNLRAHGSSIGLATVYRALADLASTGDADSITSVDGQTLFRACTTSHHHHLVCRGCSRTVEIDAAQVESWASKIAGENGFRDVSHTIELFGTCADCSRTN
ncbi:MAG: Fur family transcriptional regulator [Microbacteriaceae bacterium]